MLDSLHHAREHLSLEQNLAVLRWLTEGYGTDDRITHIVNVREVWIVFAVNPDGAEYDLTGSPVPCLAQEPPAECGDDRDRDGPQPELRLPVGLLRRLVRLEIGLDLSRASRVLGARDARHPRLHGQPADRVPSADQDRDHLPHGR